MTERHAGGHPSFHARFSADDLPVDIQIRDRKTNELLHSQAVREPGAVEIPSFGPRPVLVRILTKDGRVLEGEGEPDVELAGTPVDPSQYDTVRRAVWEGGLEQLVADGLQAPVIYSGSVEAPCVECGIQVALGPRQQKVLVQCADEGRVVRITCLICSARRAAESSQSWRLHNLGNPEDPNSDPEAGKDAFTGGMDDLVADLAAEMNVAGGLQQIITQPPEGPNS